LKLGVEVFFWIVLSLEEGSDLSSNTKLVDKDELCEGHRIPSLSVFTV